MANRCSAVPLFSPSQVSSREHVLRSIWSPSPVKAVANVCPARTPQRTRKIDVSMDEFYSPLAGASPISVITEGTSFRSSMPVDMFSFDFVSTCQSEHELQQIVETLQENNPGSYPSLLKTARRQLDAITAERKNVTWARHTDQNKRDIRHESPPPHEQQSSLAMSLSTTNILEDSIQLSPTSNDKYFSSTPKTTSPRLFAFPEEPFAEELDQVQEERRHLEHQLTQQVQQLQQSLDKDRKQQSQAIDQKIKELENDRATAEGKVQQLEQALHLSTSKHQSLLKTLDYAQQDTAALRHQLEHEQRQSQDTVVSARETEYRLRQELDQARNNTASRQAELALERSKADLNTLQHEQTKLLSALQHAVGHDPSKVATMDSEAKSDLVRNVTLKLASSRAAVKAFAQAMASAEKDRSTLREAHRLAQSRVQELKSMNERLKRENELLIQQNASLNDHFKDFQSQASTKMADLQIQHQEYQQTIGLLKKQIRSSESSVSMSLYQRTVAEARELQQQLQDKSAQIQRLEEKVDLVQRMGRQMKEQYERSIQEREQVLEEHRRREAFQEKQEQQYMVQDLRQKEIYKRQQEGKERRLHEARKVQAVLDMAPPAQTVYTNQRNESPSGGNSIGKVYIPKNTSPAIALKISSATAPSPSPPVTRSSPNGTTPSRHQATPKSGPSSSTKSAVQKFIPFPPPSAPPVRDAITPSRSETTRSPVLPQLQKFPIFVGGGIPPPPKSSTPASSERQSPVVTQRAFKRLNAITAAGGRNSIREKLNTIRRSPLGNATNTTRDVVY